MSDALRKAVALRNAVLQAWREEGFPVAGRWNMPTSDYAEGAFRCEKCPDLYPFQERVYAYGFRLRALRRTLASAERDSIRGQRRKTRCPHLYSFVHRPTYWERELAPRVGLILLEGQVFGGAP